MRTSFTVIENEDEIVDFCEKIVFQNSKRFKTNDEWVSVDAAITMDIHTPTGTDTFKMVLNDCYADSEMRSDIAMELANKLLRRLDLHPNIDTVEISTIQLQSNV